MSVTSTGIKQLLTVCSASAMSSHYIDRRGCKTDRPNTGSLASRAGPADIAIADVCMKLESFTYALRL